MEINNGIKAIIDALNGGKSILFSERLRDIIEAYTRIKHPAKYYTTATYNGFFYLWRNV